MARRSGVSIETTIYGTFKGADFSTDPSLVDKRRSPLCTNMIADGGGMPEKRTGWRTLYNLGGQINGLYYGNFDGLDVFLAHAGGEMYRWTETEPTPELLMSGLFNGPSQGVSMVGKLWIVTGGEYLVYDGEDLKRVDDPSIAYVPTTVISRSPAGGGGASYEDVNLLTVFRKNSFLPDDESLVYALDAENLYTELSVGDAGLAEGSSYYFVSGPKFYAFTASRDCAPGELIVIDFEELTATIGETVEALTAEESAAGTDLETVAELTEASKITVEVWGEELTEGYTVDRAAGTVTFAIPAEEEFKGTGSQKAFDLAKNCVAVTGVTVNGTAVTTYTFDGAAHKLTFTTAPTNGAAIVVSETQAPAAPVVGQEDGVLITFPKPVEGYKERANGCTIITAFGVGGSDRVIISGNPEYSNLDWTSGLNDPAYMPDLSYSNVGIEGVPIVGYARLGANLGIVKEDTGQDSTVYIRSAAADASGNAVFTLRAAVAGVGAVAKGSFAALLDEQLFLSGTGIYAITTNVYTSERITQNRSYYINHKLTQEQLENAVAVQWRGMYLLAIGNGAVYVLDARQQKSYRSESLGDFVYEGYYWENVPARCWLNHKDGADENLYFGTADGRVCRFNTDIPDMSRFSDDGNPISAVWATKSDDDGDATLLKTMIKRGAAVTIKPYKRSSAKICIRTDRDAVDWQCAYETMDIFDWEDIDFSRFTFNSNDAPSEIMLNTKVKKYKRLQIVVKNDGIDEGFGVFAVTKHYVVGNYAKK